MTGAEMGFAACDSILVTAACPRKAPADVSPHAIANAMSAANIAIVQQAR